MKGNFTYRPEVDGLRALAAIPVILSHLKPILFQMILNLLFGILSIQLQKGKGF
tara:strand:+ start:1404 stop:1565 length:162 start_codon:yes stop_codon:yes gene_type:complete